MRAAHSLYLPLLGERLRFTIGWSIFGYNCHFFFEFIAEFYKPIDSRHRINGARKPYFRFAIAI